MPKGKIIKPLPVMTKGKPIQVGSGRKQIKRIKGGIIGDEVPAPLTRVKGPGPPTHPPPLLPPPEDPITKETIERYLKIRPIFERIFPEAPLNPFPEAEYNQVWFPQLTQAFQENNLYQIEDFARDGITNSEIQRINQRMIDLIVEIDTPIPGRGFIRGKKSKPIQVGSGNTLRAMFNLLKVEYTDEMEDSDNNLVASAQLYLLNHEVPDENRQLLQQYIDRLVPIINYGSRELRVNNNDRRIAIRNAIFRTLQDFRGRNFPLRDGIHPPTPSTVSTESLTPPSTLSPPSSSDSYDSSDELLGDSIRGDYAKLSKGSYGSQDIKGYTIDRGLSNQNRTTYVKDGKAIVSFRGTDLKTKDNKWKDLGTDALIFFGLERFGSRFKNAVKATKKVVEKYGKDNVELTGHSLGGSQALYVGKELGLPVKAFNPGTSPADVIRDKFEAPPTAETKVYTTGIDPISGLATQLKGVDTELVMPNSLNVHGVSNFYDNDKEGSGLSYEQWIEIDGHHYHFPLNKFVLKIDKPLEGGHIYKLLKQGPDCYDLIHTTLGTVHGHCLKEDKAKEQLELFNKAYDASMAKEKIAKDEEIKKKILKKNKSINKKKKMSDSDSDSSSKSSSPPKSTATTWRTYWSNYCKGKKFGSRQAVNDAMREAAKKYKESKK